MDSKREKISYTYEVVDFMIETGGLHTHQVPLKLTSIYCFSEALTMQLPFMIESCVGNKKELKAVWEQFART